MKHLKAPLLAILLYLATISACGNDGKIKLTINSNYLGAATISGGGRYNQNEMVHLSCAVNNGYVFLGWYQDDICLSTFEEFNFQCQNKNVVIEARFKLANYILSLESNNSSNGLVSYKCGNEKRG